MEAETLIGKFVHCTMLLALCPVPLFAALEPIVPVDGETVPLLPENQKKVIAMPTLAERIAFFTDNKANKDVCIGTLYRTSAPIVFRFRDTDNPDGPSWNGPWKVFIGKKPDLSDARVFCLWQDPSPGPNDGDAWKPTAIHEYRLEVPGANLEIGTRYYWKITCRRRCSLQCDPTHGCERAKNYDESPVVEFRTEDIAPRWIALAGPKLFNVRDLGGRIGRCGRRVRQGMIYRGATLNDDSMTDDIPGKSRLMADDLAYMTGVLGVSRHETETDWEVTFYPYIPDANPDDWRGERHFDEGFGKYGDADAPWDERIILYLKGQGITDAEIEKFRAIMLE